MTQRQSWSKLSGVTKIEARRLARNMIKDEIKRQGNKVTHYEAKDIAEAAHQLLTRSVEAPALIKQAQSNIKRRKANEPRP